jgi:hypothetical protein
LTLANLHKFREIAIGFRDTNAVGQGFADEIFRVFAQAHPQIELSFEHASAAVTAMRDTPARPVERVRPPQPLRVFLP